MLLFPWDKNNMNYWIVLLISLLFSSVGFFMYIYFFSIGYGFSIASIGILLSIGFYKQIGIAELFCCILLILYGIRLGGYLLIRDLKNSAYQKILQPERERSKRMGIGAKLAIWFSCAILYTLQTCPIFFRLSNRIQTNSMLWFGVFVMLFGLILETVADLQKSIAKKKNSQRFIDTGLYRFVRCPNYLGEMIFWLGMFLTGFTALIGLKQWCMAILGFILIIFIMFSGTRRLEIRQDKNYMNDPEYQKYSKTVPILIPFIPLYSVKKYKFLVA